MGEPTAMDMVIGGMLIVVSLEMGRRVLGNVLPILALIFMTYAFVGPWLPDIVFAHKGFTLQRILEFMASEVAVFGVVINAYASYVFLFIAFAAFLEEAGGGNFLVQFANALAGRSRGGPAKVAVISSGFVGSMMGSGVANVVATGSFTIPLMKRTGYRPHIAGAVEAAASTGGQFMPPIMGAAAFIIAAITEIPYVEVIAVAAVPAVIYFLSILFFVHIEATKEGIRLVPADEVPALKSRPQEWGPPSPAGLLHGFRALKGAFSQPRRRGGHLLHRRGEFPAAGDTPDAPASSGRPRAGSAEFTGGGRHGGRGGPDDRRHHVDRTGDQVQRFHHQRHRWLPLPHPHARGRRLLYPGDGHDGGGRLRRGLRHCRARFAATRRSASGLSL